VFDRRSNCARRPERGFFRKRRLKPIGKWRVQSFDSAPRLQLRAQP
jgi:hypothetical protein